MEHALLYAVTALAISVVLNIVLKKIGISQVIGYILTGTIIVYAFDLRDLNDSHALEQIAEFGIVFLMFTIGLELSLSRLGALKQIVFFNGAMQVLLTAVIVYGLAHYLFGIALTSSIIIASSFALSSTAVVLGYLKTSKEIFLPYGQRAMGILVFQDIAVIPILLLIGFLSNDGGDWQITLVHTFVSALLVLGLLFTVGRPLMTWLLHFAADSGIEELFLGSVLVIAVGASLLADALGFTYSLGAFLAGVIIAETSYHHKVEADIASFKDLLLGVFFVTVGMKIDLVFFAHHLLSILAVLTAVMMLKSLIIFSLIRLSSPKPVALKTALSLSQLGEFSFAIFALASSYGLLNPALEQYLIMIVVVSLVITPFHPAAFRPEGAAQRPAARRRTPRPHHHLRLQYGGQVRRERAQSDEYGLRYHRQLAQTRQRRTQVRGRHLPGRPVQTGDRRGAAYGKRLRRHRDPGQPRKEKPHLRNGAVDQPAGQHRRENHHARREIRPESLACRSYRRRQT
jgi:monovalent cation:H+ antiporter-2, CPA2 family